MKPRNGILGQVFAGKVIEIGNKVKRFNVGDKVYGLTGFSLGAYAEYKAINEIDSKQGCVARMPCNISFEEATYAAYGGLLAMQFLNKLTINKDDNNTSLWCIKYFWNLCITVSEITGCNSDMCLQK